MKEIGDFSIIFEKFDIVSETIVSFLHSDYQFPFRIIFDIDIFDESPTCGYPLVFLLDAIDGILKSFKLPNSNLFAAITLMCILSIKENTLDSTTETAVATVAASVVFQKLFPKFDPLKFNQIENSHSLP